MKETLGGNLTTHHSNSDYKTTNQEQVETNLGEALHKSPLGIFHTIDLLLQTLHISRHMFSRYIIDPNTLPYKGNIIHHTNIT